MKYGARKSLGCISTVVSTYFATAFIVFLIKSTKIVKNAICIHSLCSRGLDIAEFYFSTPINIFKISIFDSPVIIENQGFNSFSNSEEVDVLSEIEDFIDNKK